MKKILMTAAAGALALTAFTSSASAQQARNCAPRDLVVERLAEKYGESRQSIGMGANNSVVETYANNKTGSWTITVTMPNGMTCLVASGQAFENLNEELPNTDDDA